MLLTVCDRCGMGCKPDEARRIAIMGSSREHDRMFDLCKGCANEILGWIKVVSLKETNPKGRRKNDK